MTREKGIVPFSANFEPNFSEPLDARLRVGTKAALLLPETWESSDGGLYLYLGMQVSVYSDGVNNGIYLLVGSDYTLESSWLYFGTSASTHTFEVDGDIDLDLLPYSGVMHVAVVGGVAGLNLNTAGVPTNSPLLVVSQLRDSVFTLHFDAFEGKIFPIGLGGVNSLDVTTGSKLLLVMYSGNWYVVCTSVLGIDWEEEEW